MSDSVEVMDKTLLLHHLIKPRAGNTPGLNYSQYAKGPLSLHCVHNLSLPRIWTAASLLNYSIPRPLTGSSGYVCICGTPLNEGPKTRPLQGKFGPSADAYPYINNVWHKQECTLGQLAPFTVTLHKNSQCHSRWAIGLILAGNSSIGRLCLPWGNPRKSIQQFKEPSPEHWKHPKQIFNLFKLTSQCGHGQ